ncbi:ketimine reductase mu-crystallin-like [Episyrphus balteatus]|uniref:ketimine reductase mu-crystallin-like n=1 Tax=Episyrphus balteatus TaxID=286459 RepID=UPI0024863FAF|nr:ketimine reductase mu-crystallin-like [Episyrphus balteatus]
MARPVFISLDEVKSVLTWSLVNESIEEAFKSVVVGKDKLTKYQNHPYAYQNARTVTKTQNEKVWLYTMPGYIGNHKVTLEDVKRKAFETVACKLLTWSGINNQLNPAIPNILSNILLFDEKTGQLKCIMDGDLITAWRTASASVVATKYLYFGRRSVNASDGVILAIIGCGVQGKSHALGMCTEFKVNEIRLWNRTAKKAVDLSTHQDNARKTFVNPNLKVTVCHTVGECVANADIIVTCSDMEKPLLHLNMLKDDVHINAVGVSVNHYSELGQDIYDVAPVYIDSWAGAKTELAGLKTNLVCEVGEVIFDGGMCPKQGISVFQSLGMAVEDAAVAQAVYQKLKRNNQITSKI